MAIIQPRRQESISGQLVSSSDAAAITGEGRQRLAKAAQAAISHVRGNAEPAKTNVGVTERSAAGARGEICAVAGTERFIVGGGNGGTLEAARQLRSINRNDGRLV